MKCVHLSPRAFMTIDGNMSRCTPLKICCHNVQIDSLFKKKSQHAVSSSYQSRTGNITVTYVQCLFYFSINVNKIREFL